MSQLLAITPVGGATVFKNVGEDLYNSADLEGSFTAVGNSAVYVPKADESFNISIWGTFIGTVRLTRSFNGGPFLPITANGTALMVFNSPVSEQWNEPEANVSYRLECTSYTSGTILFRLSQ